MFLSVCMVCICSATFVVILRARALPARSATQSAGCAVSPPPAASAQMVLHAPSSGRRRLRGKQPQTKRLRLRGKQPPAGGSPGARAAAEEAFSDHGRRSPPPHALDACPHLWPPRCAAPPPPARRQLQPPPQPSPATGVYRDVAGTIW